LGLELHGEGLALASAAKLRLRLASSAPAWTAGGKRFVFWTEEMRPLLAEALSASKIFQLRDTPRSIHILNRANAHGM